MAKKERAWFKGNKMKVAVLFTGLARVGRKAIELTLLCWFSFFRITNLAFPEKDKELREEEEDYL